ncbi:MAG: response regulator [Pseudomonadota bacterium]
MAKSVLIVDDDKGGVKYLSTVLQENGYEPYAAYDGQEGLKKLQEIKPDVLVLDVMMPKKSGFILFKQMKQDDELKNIPVIMLTSVSRVVDVDMKEEGKGDAFSEIKGYFSDKLGDMVESYRAKGEVRPDIFLDKPIEPDTFINAIKKLIGDA